MTSLVAQMVKHLHTMRETWVQSLGWEDLLEKDMATHSSILAWKIPWTEEPSQSMGSLRVGHDWATLLSFSLSCIGEGNGNPLQCSCLENPRTGEPGGLPSLGSHRVGHDWSDLAAAAAAVTMLNDLRTLAHTVLAKRHHWIYFTDGKLRFNKVNWLSPKLNQNQ